MFDGNLNRRAGDELVFNGEANFIFKGGPLPGIFDAGALDPLENGVTDDESLAPGPADEIKPFGVLLLDKDEGATGDALGGIASPPEGIGVSL